MKSICGKYEPLVLKINPLRAEIYAFNNYKEFETPCRGTFWSTKGRWKLAIQHKGFVGKYVACMNCIPKIVALLCCICSPSNGLWYFRFDNIYICHFIRVINIQAFYKKNIQQLKALLGFYPRATWCLGVYKWCCCCWDPLINFDSFSWNYFDSTCLNNFY